MADAPTGLETPVWDQWEEWRPVVLDGQEWPYEVSDVGRVRRSAGGSNRTLHASGKGYLQVNLCREGRKKSVKVHVLVAHAFLGAKPTPKHEINHEDGDKRNNRIWNLEWITRGGNQRHAWRYGLKKSSDHAKLTPLEVGWIRSLWAEGGRTQGQIGGLFGIHKRSVSDIVRGRRWKSVAA